jgi:hypothetical protein
VTGGIKTAIVRFTLSEAATVTIRFVATKNSEDPAPVTRVEGHSGTATLQRPLAKGTYTVQLTAVDPLGNHSSTYTREVKVVG